MQSRFRFIVGIPFLLALCGMLAFGVWRSEQRQVIDTSEYANKLHYTLWWNDSIYMNIEELKPFIEQVIQNGGKSMFVSVSWAQIETTKDQFDFEYTRQRLDIITGAGLDLNIILDASIPNSMSSIPGYIFQDYPDCLTKDFRDQAIPVMSFSNQPCIERAYHFFDLASRYFLERYKEQAIAFQPNFNNEYELKYTQYRYHWEDYNELTKQEFRKWLRQQNSDVEFWNSRWQLQLQSLDEIEPPIIDYNANTEPDTHQIYYDWQRFREQRLITRHLEAAKIIRGNGGKVVFHFGEWGTANDAIYGSPITPIMKSGLVDYIIIDSNLKDTIGNKNKPIIGAILATAVKRSAVPATFELALERLDVSDESDQLLGRQTLLEALKYGVRIALTNIDSPEQAKAILRFPSSKMKVHVSCSQAIYRSRWEYYAYHGASEKIGDETIDPLQRRLFDIFEKASQNGCVEIWDDENITKENLSSIKRLWLSGSRVVRKEALDTIQEAEKDGLKVMRDSETARFIIDSDFRLQSQVTQ